MRGTQFSRRLRQSQRHVRMDSTADLSLVLLSPAVVSRRRGIRTNRHHDRLLIVCNFTEVLFVLVFVCHKSGQVLFQQDLFCLSIVKEILVDVVCERIGTLLHYNHFFFGPCKIAFQVSM